MDVLIFRLKEVQARYDVKNKDLAAAMGVGKSIVSEWRSGAKSPSLERLDQLLNALVEVADPKLLELYPLSLTDLIDWQVDKPAAGGVSR